MQFLIGVIGQKWIILYILNILNGDLLEKVIIDADICYRIQLVWLVMRLGWRAVLPVNAENCFFVIRRIVTNEV
jgi:hypothetical protein